MEPDVLRTTSEEETIAFGEQFAAWLEVGDVVGISGDLGAGKTEFVKGVCDYFSVQDLVSSPTFTIINQYAGTTPDGEAVKLYHVDLYRIDTPKDLAEVGFDECVYAHDAIKLVEWPEKAESHMPPHAWRVQIDPSDDGEDVRVITVTRPDVREERVEE
jgi:tRNA threonylcarbamoyladenosine biosynthesis protein TsaE